MTKNAGQLIGHRYKGYILRSSRLELIQPLAEAMLVSFYSCQHGTSSMGGAVEFGWIGAIAFRLRHDGLPFLSWHSEQDRENLKLAVCSHSVENGDKGLHQ